MKPKTITLTSVDMVALRLSLVEALAEMHEFSDAINKVDVPWKKIEESIFTSPKEIRIIMCALKLTSKNGYGVNRAKAKRLKKKIREGG